MMADHPPPELLFGYEHGLLLPEELREVDGHVAICSDCREKLALRMGIGEMAADVRSDLASDPQRSSFRILPYLAVAALVTIAAGSIWLARHPPPLATVSRRTEADSAAVQQALRLGRIPVPAFLDALRPPREVLMGEARAMKAEVLSPSGTAVLGPGVEFRWEPRAGGWSYRVRVFTLGGDPVVSGPESREPRWSCREGLLRGVDYEWQVAAERGSERVTLPEPPQVPPRFRILDSPTAERLRGLARRDPAAHLRLGVAYARAGALDDARAELAEALRQDPRRADILRLQESLAASKR